MNEVVLKGKVLCITPYHVTLEIRALNVPQVMLLVMPVGGIFTLSANVFEEKITDVSVAHDALEAIRLASRPGGEPPPGAPQP